MFSRQLEGDHYCYTYILCCLLAQRDFSEILQTAAYKQSPAGTNSTSRFRALKVGAGMFDVALERPLGNKLYHTSFLLTIHLVS